LQLVLPSDGQDAAANWGGVRGVRRERQGETRRDKEREGDAADDCAHCAAERARAAGRQMTTAPLAVHAPVPVLACPLRATTTPSLCL